MPEFTVILRGVSLEKFSEMIQASSRKAREIYFHRHNIRAPKNNGRLIKPGAKNEARTQELYKLLQATLDDNLAQEVLRTWLLTKRAMLARALDHLGIAHENGLTQSDDVQKIEKLSAKEIKGLVAAIGESAPREDVLVYLRFMGAANVEAIG